MATLCALGRYCFELGSAYKGRARAHGFDKVSLVYATLAYPSGPQSKNAPRRVESALLRAAFCVLLFVFVKCGVRMCGLFVAVCV